MMNLINLAWLRSLYYRTQEESNKTEVVCTMQ